MKIQNGFNGMEIHESFELWDSGDEKFLIELQSRYENCKEVGFNSEAERLKGIIGNMMTRKFASHKKASQRLVRTQKPTTLSSDKAITEALDEMSEIQKQFEKLHYGKDLSKRKLRRNNEIINQIVSEFKSLEKLRKALSVEFTSKTKDRHSARLMITIRDIINKIVDKPHNKAYEKILNYTIRDDFGSEVIQIIKSFKPEIFDKKKVWDRGFITLKGSQALSRKSKRRKLEEKSIQDIETPSFAEELQKLVNADILSKEDKQKAIIAFQKKKSLQKTHKIPILKSKVASMINRAKYAHLHLVTKTKAKDEYIGQGEMVDIKSPFVAIENPNAELDLSEKVVLWDSDTAKAYGVLQSLAFKDFDNEFYKNQSSYRMKGVLKRQKEILAKRRENHMVDDFIPIIDKYLCKSVLLESEIPPREYLTALKIVAKQKRYAWLKDVDTINSTIQEMVKTLLDVGHTTNIVDTMVNNHFKKEFQTLHEAVLKRFRTDKKPSLSKK